MSENMTIRSAEDPASGKLDRDNEFEIQYNLGHGLVHQQCRPRDMSPRVHIHSTSTLYLLLSGRRHSAPPEI